MVLSNKIVYGKIPFKVIFFLCQYPKISTDKLPQQMAIIHNELMFMLSVLIGQRLMP